MNLLIDAGNSRIKWASVNGNEWLSSGSLPVERAFELTEQCAESLARIGKGLHDIHGVWVSNVAGELVAQYIRKLGDMPILFTMAQESQCGIRNFYTIPSQLGADRWAALIAAWHLTLGKCIVVNCGTATTIDALSERGEFLGGLILPGVELMQRSLTDATNQLKVSQGEYMPFPVNTADAMLSGAIQATCGAIQRQQKLLEVSTILLSGGAAGLLQPFLAKSASSVDNLVLRGLLLISQEVNAK